MTAAGPLAGRAALVTGVSRRAGIGFALARRLLADGAHVFVQSWAPHDAEQPWGAEPDGVQAVLDTLGGTSDRLAHAAVDLAEPEAATQLVDEVVERFGVIDVLVANHARSSEQDLEHLTADELDRCWAVNARGSLLLAQRFAARHDDARPGGRLVLFTSGQHLGPMWNELPYAVTKGAIHQMTLSLADHLADRGITVNAVNPGPTDTGWASPELVASLGRRLPNKRWGQPDDVANLVAFLASDQSAWITGQVLNSEGGFRRWG